MPDRSVVYRFTGDFKSLTAGLTAAGRSVNDFGGKLTALDQNGAKMRAGLETVGRTAGRVGLVAAGGLAVIVGAAANFDKAMSSVQAATHETADNMGLLREAAIQAGADTAFSASEAAGAIENLAKAGVSTKDILTGGLSGALDLAAAGSLDVASASEIAATTLTQFGLKGDQASRVADVLAAAAGKAQGEVTDMAGAMKYVGPVAAQMGISLEETAGTIAELASQGIIGEQAGTSLRGMLTSLTSPSVAAKKEMDALGISLYDANGAFIGFDGLAGQLQQTMSGLTNAERDQSLGRIFGNEQITAARILYAGGAADVQKWTKAVDDQGYAAETAGIKLDNLAGDLEALKGSLETFLIGAGEGSQGPLRKLTQGATDAINALNALPAPLKNTATNMLAITAITGGALWFGSKVVAGIASTRLALSQLSITAAGTRAALVGTAKSAAVLYAATESVTTGVDLARGAVAAFKTATADTSNSVDTLLSTLQQSNVGRYADELGIDVQRLAQDLYANGESGEYVGEVMELLNGKMTGVAGAIDAVQGKINPFDQSLTHAQGAAADLDQAMGKVGHATGTWTEEAKAAARAAQGIDPAMTVAANKTATYEAATRQAARGARLSAEAIKAQAEALKESRDAAEQSARGFVNLGDSLDDGKVSLQGWIRDLEKQAAALRDFRKNAETAADKGLRQGLIAALQEMGPAGALRLKQLANATDSEIRRANKAWISGQREIDKYVDATGGVPGDKSTNLHLNGFPTAMQQIANLKSAYDSLRDKTIHIGIVTNQGKSAALGLDHYDGGYTGDGGKYEPAGIVHRGEVVIPADRVKRDWSMLSARYGDLPGMATGGLAGSFAREGGPGDDAAREGRNTARALKELQAALKKSTSAFEENKAQLQEMRAYSQQVATSVSGDLFGNGLAGFNTALDANRNDSRSVLKALKQAQNRGLSGPLLDALAASGDAQTIIEFANQSKAQIRQQERRYGSLLGAQNQLGTFAAQEKFDETFSGLRNTNERLTKRINELTKELKHVGKRVEDGAHKGSRDGANDKSRRTATRSRAGR